MSNLAAIILAAGQASRYRAQDAGVASKLVAQINGKALVRHVAEAALASRVEPVIVVTGHARDDIQSALAGCNVIFVHNPDFAQGMAGSLQRGILALPAEVKGALILLADMPFVSADLINSLAISFGGHDDVDAVIPLYNGQRGNPVLLSRKLFAAVSALRGDEGARRLLASPLLNILEIAAPEQAIIDIDTPEALRAAGHTPPEIQK